MGDSPLGARPDTRDAITVIGKTSDETKRPYNVILDHISASWGLDETVAVKDTASYVTISNSIIAEGLEKSLHPKSPHSKGLMVSANYQTIYRNLISSVRDRAPLETSPNGVLINNISNNSLYSTFGELTNNEIYDGMVRNTVALNNVKTFGLDKGILGATYWAQIFTNPFGSRMFLEGAACEDVSNVSWPCVHGDQLYSSDIPVQSITGIKVLPTDEVLDKVLPNVGARPTDRDSVDTRIVAEVLNGQAKVKDCVEAGTIYYPVGMVTAATANTFTAEQVQCYSDRYASYVVEIYQGTGAGQSKTITDEACLSGTTAQFTVDTDWATVPDTNSQYRIKNVCTNDAGGWPVLAENTRALSLPSNPDEIQSSGYTKLEEYLHSFYSQVEPSSSTNVAPKAVIAELVTAVDSDASGGETVTVDGSTSSDSDGSISSYKWFVDSSLVAGQTASHLSYDFPVGSHSVRLEVRDNGGLTGQAVGQVIVGSAGVVSRFPGLWQHLLADYEVDNTFDNSFGRGESLAGLNGISFSTSSSSGTHALLLDGVDDNATFDLGRLLNGLSEFTLSVRVKADSTGSDRGILYGGNGDNRLTLRYDQSGFLGGGTNIIKFGIGINGVTKQLETVSNLQSTAWQHIVVTWKSGEAMKMYVNGVPVGLSYDEGVVTGKISDVSTAYLGRHAEGYWAGLIDQVLVFGEKLDASDVTWLYSHP